MDPSTIGIICQPLHGEEVNYSFGEDDKGAQIRRWAYGKLCVNVWPQPSFFFFSLSPHRCSVLSLARDAFETVNTSSGRSLGLCVSVFCVLCPGDPVVLVL